MPVNLESLRADPEFLRLSPQEQQQLLQAAGGQGTATPSQSHESAPQATQPAGGVNLQALQGDPEFQALSAPDQARVWSQAQTTLPAGQRQVTPSMPPGVPSIEQETLSEGITAPSTMIPLLMGGAGVKAVHAAIPKAYQWLARPVVEGLSQTAGWLTGRTAETGKLPSAGETATEAALAIGTGGILEIPAAARQALRWSKGGQAILGADDATAAAKSAWQTAQAEADALQQSANKEVYDRALRKANGAQAKYQRQLEHRQTVIDAQKQTYDDAVRATQEGNYQTAREGVLAEHQAGAARVGQYQQAVTGQRQAVAQARAVPGRYTPETPSWLLYEKFGDAAKDAVVDLGPAKAALVDVRASRGVLPDGSIRPFPSAVESIASNLEKATGETSFKTIREELRRLGPLTRSQDGNVRGAAKQLYGIYADVLEASPIANDLLRNANTTFRKEMALQDMKDWLTPGHGVVRIDNQGRETINVGALMTRLEKQTADDSLFRGAFAPDELQTMRADFGRLAGTPSMPRGGPPAAPQPVQLPGVMQDLPTGMQRPPTAPVMPQPPSMDLLPGGAGAGRAVPGPGEAPGAMTPRDVLGTRPPFKPGSLGEIGGLEYLAASFGIPRGVIAAAKIIPAASQQARHALAYAVTSERLRPFVVGAMKPDGTLDPRVYGLIVAAMTKEEKAAMERATTTPYGSKRAGVTAP